MDRLQKRLRHDPANMDHKMSENIQNIRES